MSKEDYNATLQHGIELIRRECSRRFCLKNYDDELLDFDSPEYRHGIIIGLGIAEKLLEIAKCL